MKDDTSVQYIHTSEWKVDEDSELLRNDGVKATTQEGKGGREQNLEPQGKSYPYYRYFLGCTLVWKI